MSEIGIRKHLKMIVINAVIVILAISFLVFWLNTNKSDTVTTMPMNTSPVVMAHRGYHVNAVENTLGSLEAAAGFKPDYVELDVVNLLISKNVDTKYLIQSLDWNTVLKVNELAPEISAGFIALNRAFDINNAGIDFISIPSYDVAKDLLSHKDVTNKPIYVWTIDAEESIEKVFSEGASGVITNKCNEAITIRDQLKNTGSIK